VYAFRRDAHEHGAYRGWLEGAVAGDEAFGVADLVLSGFLRVVTHPRVFAIPSRIERALAFADALRGAPNAIQVTPQQRHWDVFTRLCREAGTKGNLVADAYLAALAIESGSEWITTDRDFARFPGLRWRHPLLGTR
jgi:uncharacterized protein